MENPFDAVSLVPDVESELTRVLDAGHATAEAIQSVVIEIHRQHVVSDDRLQACRELVETFHKLAGHFTAVAGEIH